MEGRMKERCTAIVLAAGSGKRMGGNIAKQFMSLGGMPVICHSLQVLERSAIIDECIVVTCSEDIVFFRREILEKYGFSKVKTLVAGGRERCESVYNALRAMGEGNGTGPDRGGYIFIHDGARPFLTEKILEDTYNGARLHGACAAAMPVKDTIKIADESGFVVQTPDRRLLWAVQTPQVFAADIIRGAYERIFGESAADGSLPAVTDDAMVVEKTLGVPVKLIPASYTNIKITTPEDMETAERFFGEFFGGKTPEK